MNLELFHSKGALPVDRKTGERIIAAMDAQRLVPFAEKHPLTLAHFLLSGFGGYHYTPLDHAAAHGYLDQVAAVFNGSGRWMVPENFLVPGEVGWTALHYAARDGHIDQVVAAVQPSGKRLTAAHFLTQSDGMNTPLRLASDNRHLDQVFAPALWTGRVNEMEMLWGHVREEWRGSLDYEAARHEAILLSVRGAPKIDPADFAQARRGTAIDLEAAGWQGRERS